MVEPIISKLGSLSKAWQKMLPIVSGGLHSQYREKYHFSGKKI